MSTPLTGRVASIRIGGVASSSPGTVINNLGHWEITFNFDELDASVFGTVWKKNMTGMQGWSGTVEGFFDPSTAANTQITALMNPALDATKIQDIRFYLQTSSGLFFMPNFSTLGGVNTDTDAGAYISNVRITADKNGLTAASFNVLGYGGLCMIQGVLASSTGVILEAV